MAGREGDGRITIEREGDGFEVTVTDPDIRAANRKDGPWTDPDVEYSFDTWEQVCEFLDKIYTKALPASDFNSAFDKAAKEVMKNGVD